MAINPDLPAIEQFWAAFCEAADVQGPYADAIPFGDSPEMADELAALVLNGTKRATAGLARGSTPETLPKVGDYVIVLNGQGAPACIYQSTDVRVGPLSSVDDAFAWDEGEGDRSRAWWLEAHLDFFNREAALEGFDMHDDIETVFERFKIVWPPASAD